MANDLQDFKLDDLYESIALPDQDFKQFMASQGLLHGSMDCPRCQQPMILEEGHGREPIWRCNRRIHRPEKPAKGFKVVFYALPSSFKGRNVFRR